MIIDIPLTGGRTYIHGADIFDALTAATGAATDIVLSLKTAGACSLELREEPAVTPCDEPCGRFRYARAGDIRRHILLRRPDRPISIRVPMSDDALVADATFFSGSAAVGAGAPGGTFMRRATALAVALLERDHPDDYWSIAKIFCQRLPHRDAVAEVTIRNAVGNRFWNIAARADGVPVGHITMARGQPRR
jgi:hypothetical protein